MIRTAPAKPGHNSGIGDTVAAGQLRAFVERVEQIEAEIKDLNADKSEIYKEAKGTGFDVPTLKRIVSARKLDSADREERDAIFDLYWAALSEPVVHVHVRTRENIEQFGAISPAPHSPGLTAGDPNPSTEAAGAKSEGVVPLAGQDADETGGEHRSSNSVQQDASKPQGRNEPVSGEGATANNSDGLDIPEFLRRSK